MFKPNVVEGPRDGSGRERLVVDDMLTEKECSLLLELATKVTMWYFRFGASFIYWNVADHDKLLLTAIY